MGFERWLDDFDFDVPEFHFPLVTLAECNRILTEKEQRGIVWAAEAVHKGFPAEAEMWRDSAGYAGLNK